MRFILPFILVLAFTSAIRGQAADSSQLVVVDVPAEFPGGMANFYKYINKKLRYPKGYDVTGRVYVDFIIGENGKIIKSSVRALSRTEILKSPGVAISISDDLLDDQVFLDEATRVILKSPPWTPARHDGVPVRQGMVVPIMFFP